MIKCEWCDKLFDPIEADEYFTKETYLLSYDNIQKCLCGECAVKVIEDKVDGIYFETCEKCGRTFDLIEDECTFNSNFSWFNGTSLRDYWDKQILCADCALAAFESEQIDNDNNNYDNDDENDEEIDVYNAALIWASHGKDEDYTFGYSEDELEAALNS